jgi:hypothetical protein
LGRGDQDLAVHADVLQRLTRAALAHRDHRRAAEAVAHHGLHGRVLERPGADRVDHDRHPVLVRQHHLAQKDLRLAVEQNAAAAEDEQVEALDLGHDLVARELAHRDRTFDLVPRAGVVGVARKDRDLERQRTPQLFDDARENGLIAKIEAAVRARDADPECLSAPRHRSSPIALTRQRVIPGKVPG